MQTFLQSAHVTTSMIQLVFQIFPAHKKDSKISKENYIPISILPNVSKIY